MKYLFTVALPILFVAGGASYPELSTMLINKRSKTALTVEALMRLPNIDVNENAALKETALRYVESLGDDPKQIEIVRKLRLKGLADRMLTQAVAWGMSTQSVQAVELVAQQDGMEVLKSKLCDTSPTESTFTLARIASLSNKREFMQMQEEVLSNPDVNKFVRTEAVVSLARSNAFHPKLIQLLRDGKIPEEAKALLGPTLRNSENEEVRKAAKELIPAGSGAARELPPVQQLVKRKGSIEEGRKLYFGVATCSQCLWLVLKGKM